MEGVVYHFSEEPSITVFAPRTMDLYPGEPARVWAIDEVHAPLYYLPRDCPRVAYWRLPTSSAEDVARFLGQTAARWVIAVESGWLERIRAARLYVYRLPGATFAPQGAGGGPGYCLSEETVTPLAVEPVGDLLARLVAEDVELRLTPSLWPLWNGVKESTLHFSGVRLRNARLE